MRPRCCLVEDHLATSPSTGCLGGERLKKEEGESTQRRKGDKGAKKHEERACTGTTPRQPRRVSKRARSLHRRVQLLHRQGRELYLLMWELYLLMWELYLLMWELYLLMWELYLLVR